MAPLLAVDLKQQILGAKVLLVGERTLRPPSIAVWTSGRLRRCKAVFGRSEWPGRRRQPRRPAPAIRLSAYRMSTPESTLPGHSEAKTRDAGHERRRRSTEPKW